MLTKANLALFLILLQELKMAVMPTWNFSYLPLLNLWKVTSSHCLLEGLVMSVLKFYRWSSCISGIYYYKEQWFLKWWTTLVFSGKTLLGQDISCLVYISGICWLPLCWGIFCMCLLGMLNFLCNEFLVLYRVILAL